MIATREIPGIDRRETARTWSRYLLMYYIPATALAFVLTAPHPWYLAIVWNFIPVPLKFLDARGIPVRDNPEGLARAPFDVHVYALAAIQLATLWLFGAMVAEHGLWRVDTVVGILLVGGAAANSTIVIAHELIHRRGRVPRLVGRALLATVFYEHFYTEHVRGHHVRVGTPEDPATARFGETFWQFYRRTIPGQFRSAWRLETARLGDVAMPWWDRRLLGSAVVHGLAAEAAYALAVLAILGPAALAVIAITAWRTVLLLEIVNYMEHWGLTRAAKKPGPQDSWDTDSGGTLYALVGLSRHADHHTHPTRPYERLRYHAESPKLPAGYLVNVDMIPFANRKFRRLMTEELRRRGLGPFRGTAA